MIMKINKIKETESGTYFRLVDTDFMLYEDSVRYLESLYKEYNSTSIPCLLAKRNYAGFTFTGLKEEDMRAYSQSVLKQLQEIKKHKNDKRIYLGDEDVRYFLYCLDDFKENDIIVNMCIVEASD